MEQTSAEGDEDEAKEPHADRRRFSTACPLSMALGGGCDGFGLLSPHADDAADADGDKYERDESE